MDWTNFNSMWTLLHRKDTVISPNETIYSHLQYTWLCSKSSCIYKVQILIVCRVTHVYTKNTNILMSVFSKLFFILYNSNVALFNHEIQLIIVKLLNGIGKVLAKFCRCRFLSMLIPLKSADTCQLIGTLLIPMSLSEWNISQHLIISAWTNLP